MPPKKKASRSFYLVPVVVVLLIILANFRFPVGAAVEIYLNKKYSNIFKELEVDYTSISVDLLGGLKFTNLRVGKPQAVFINKCNVDISLISLMFGKIELNQISGDSLLIVEEELKPFLLKLKEFNTMAKPLSEVFYGSNLDLDFKKVAIRRPQPPLQLSASNVSIEIAEPFRTSPSFGLELKNIEYPGLPKISKAKIKANWKNPLLQFSSLQIYTSSGKINAAADFNSQSNNLKGQVKFSGLSLDRLTKEKFFGESQLYGKLETILKFQIPFPNLNQGSFDGEVNGKKIRALDLPVQKDPVIENFMPAFKDLSFNKLQILKFNLEEDKIKFDSLYAGGDPLTLTGHGYFTTKGQLYIFLNCFITPEYYEELKGVVKDAMVKQEDGSYMFRCEIAGDLKNQKIKMGKIIGQVFKSNLNKIGRGIKNLFR